MPGSQRVGSHFVGFVANASAGAQYLCNTAIVVDVSAPRLQLECCIVIGDCLSDVSKLVVPVGDATAIWHRNIHLSPDYRGIRSDGLALIIYPFRRYFRPETVVHTYTYPRAAKA